MKPDKFTDAGWEKLVQELRQPRRWMEQEVIELAHDPSHLSSEKLFGYLDGTLDQSGRAAVEAHAAGCDFCLQQIAEMGELLATLGDGAEGPPGAGTTDPIQGKSAEHLLMEVAWLTERGLFADASVLLDKIEDTYPSPHVRIQCRIARARIHREEGHHDKATKELEALLIRPDLEIAEAIVCHNHLAWLKRNAGLPGQNRNAGCKAIPPTQLQPARRHLDEAGACAAGSPESCRRELAETKHQGAVLLLWEGDLVRAAEEARKVQKVREELVGLTTDTVLRQILELELARTLLLQGGILRAQHNYGFALEAFHKALAIREQVLDRPHADIADLYCWIGDLYYFQLHSWKDAWTSYQKAQTVFAACAKTAFAKAMLAASHARLAELAADRQDTAVVRIHVNAALPDAELLGRFDQDRLATLHHLDQTFARN